MGPTLPRDRPLGRLPDHVRASGHVLWMMGFPHHHHSGEHAGLYPLVVRRNPDAAVLVEWMDELDDVLLPTHLEREEQQMMPVVSRSITGGEWRARDEEFNLKPKSLRDLADEGTGSSTGSTRRAATT
jgi:hypothetical protein